MVKTVRPYDMNLTKVHLYELLRNLGANIVEDENLLLKTKLIPIIIGYGKGDAEVILSYNNQFFSTHYSRTRTAREKRL